jgi:beta-lactamase class A
MASTNRSLPGNNLFSRFFIKRIPLGITAILILAAGLGTRYFFPWQPVVINDVSKNPDCPEKMEIVRLNDYKFTHPLLFADLPNENESLNGLKEKVVQLINEDRSLNMLTDISIYFRNLKDGSWFVINGNKSYSPASLMKITYLIAILKQAMTDHNLLNKKVYFEKHFDTNFVQNIKNFSLEEKKYYTIRELLNDMIIYSDNDALTLISLNTDAKVLNKLFTDLEIKAPPQDPALGNQYVINLYDYCKLFRILYNSGYLTDEYSDLALNILSQSTFKQGFLKDFTPGFPVAHKFGERGGGQFQELHEVGIFYSSPEPYLLGVMSEGHDIQQLSSVLSQVSMLIYQNFNRGS